MCRIFDKEVGIVLLYYKSYLQPPSNQTLMYFYFCNPHSPFLHLMWIRASSSGQRSHQGASLVQYIGTTSIVDWLGVETMKETEV